MNTLAIVEGDGYITLKNGADHISMALEDFLALEPAYPQGVHKNRIYRNENGVGAHTLVLEDGSSVGREFPWPSGEEYLKKVGSYREGLAKIQQKRVAAEIAKRAEEAEKNLTWQQRRKRAYPPIGDQLDSMWKFLSTLENRTPELEAALRQIASVKERYPKD